MVRAIGGGGLPLPGEARPPRLSVIVPAYNVEQYLAACLDSILTQSYEPLEIVVVDDGSTDRTGSIARRYADRHPNVQLVATPNHGLGAARNRGIAEASGELIAFADSDDTVVAGAYEVMINALERSGSDFAVGSMQRLDGTEYDEPRWMRRLHDRLRLGITVPDLPEILGDVFAWNKVFRRSFWERHGLAFPEGVRYEDQVALTRAYLIADGFDVVPQVVYNWRIRADGSAITDRRGDLADLADRIRTKRTALQTVRALGGREVGDVFRKRVLPGDLHRYFTHIPGCSDEYWDTLRSAVREFWRDGSFRDSTLSVPNRLAGWLVARGRRRDAEAVITYAASYGGHPPTVIANDDVLVGLPYWDDPEADIPLDLYRLPSDERGWELWLRRARIDGETLVLDGSAKLRHVDSGDALVEIALTAGDGRTLISGRMAAPEIQARFDLRELVESWPIDLRDAPRIWSATGRWESHALRHEGGFTGAPIGAGASTSIGGTDVEVSFSYGGLSITVRPSMTVAAQRTPA